MVNEGDSGWKWAHYRNLSEDELELTNTGEWSDQFECETVSIIVVELAARPLGTLPRTAGSDHQVV